MNYQTEMKIKRLNNKPYITYLFLAIQIGIYLAMEIYGLVQGYGIDGSQNSFILLKFGAMFRESVVFNDEFWRFITPIFVHIGLSHIVINSFTLYLLGTQLEIFLGHKRFFFIYLFSGIVGNAVSFGFGNLHAISAGASTSLFGLFGVFLVLGQLFKSNPAIKAMSKNALLFIGINFIFNLLSPSVDMLGHVGGLIGGILTSIIVAFPLNANRRNRNENSTIHKQIIATMILIFVIVVSIILGFKRVQLLY